MPRAARAGVDPAARLNFLIRDCMDDVLPDRKNSPAARGVEGANLANLQELSTAGTRCSDVF
jgi:hypothetical protein